MEDEPKDFLVGYLGMAHASVIQVSYCFQLCLRGVSIRAPFTPDRITDTRRKR
jgi:hypothetical protein